MHQDYLPYHMYGKYNHDNPFTWEDDRSTYGNIDDRYYGYRPHRNVKRYEYDPRDWEMERQRIEQEYIDFKINSEEYSNSRARWEEDQLLHDEYRNWVKYGGHFNGRPYYTTSREPQPDYYIDSDAFDPSESPHLWAMWRSAVNDKIISKSKNISQYPHPLSRKYHQVQSLTSPPLTEHLKMGTDASSALSMSELMDSGDGSTDSMLFRGQFIYYGMPRVTTHNHKWRHFYDSSKS